MDLTLTICTMPFTQYEFYKKDHIEELIAQRRCGEYRSYFKNELSKDLYSIVSKQQRIHNLDEINLLFDKFYSGIKLSKEQSSVKFYRNLLSKLAKSFICHRNGRIALKYWESDGEEDFIGPYRGLNKIALWNSLNRMLTTDLLVICYLLDNDMQDECYLNGYYSSIMLEDLQLEQILKKGVAETHIHKGAGINFYISWQQLMTLNGKTDKDFNKELFCNEIIRSDYGLENYVKSMAILRLLMADFLRNGTSKAEDNEGRHNFNQYIEEMFEECNDEYSENKGLDQNVRYLIGDLFDGIDLQKRDYQLFKMWNRIIEKIDLGIKERLDKNQNKDIIEPFFESARSINTTVENVFLFQSMQYMRNADKDTFFFRLFWQYIRIKNQVFQSKVQGNLIKGLLHFQNYYKRSVAFKGKRDTSLTYWKIIMLNQFQNAHLKKLELRTGFGNGISIETIKRDIKKVMTSFLRAYKEIIEENYSKLEAPQVGLIFHMIKEPDHKEYEKCWQNYCAMDECELYFKELQNKYMKQVIALNSLREETPFLSDYILGIDVASVENSTEPWVFAPVYEKARNSDTHKTTYINSENWDRVKNLGFTFHAGEDFRHLATGLRRVDEVIEHFKFHAGDRIGHGIALGLKVEKWVKNNKIVVIPRGEYLDNLLWIWGLYKDGKYEQDFSMGYLEHEILKYAQSIYRKMDGINPYSLWRAYRTRFESFIPKKSYSCGEKEVNNKLFCQYVSNSEAEMWDELKIAHAYHCQIYLERMLEPIQVEINQQDEKILRQVQKVVVHKISNEGIVIETNPTSNVVIGEIESIFEHYIHNLNQRGLGSKENEENAVMISINSDDPSVFNTNVSNEFAYVFYSLQEKGYTREEAITWIDKIRRYGMESSFIEDRKIDNKTRIAEIEKLLETLKQ